MQQTARLQGDSSLSQWIPYLMFKTSPWPSKGARYSSSVPRYLGTSVHFGFITIRWMFFSTDFISTRWPHNLIPERPSHFRTSTFNVQFFTVRTFNKPYLLVSSISRNVIFTASIVTGNVQLVTTEVFNNRPLRRHDASRYGSWSLTKGTLIRGFLLTREISVKILGRNRFRAFVYVYTRRHFLMIGLSINRWCETVKTISLKVEDKRVLPTDIRYTVSMPIQIPRYKFPMPINRFHATEFPCRYRFPWMTSKSRFRLMGRLGITSVGGLSFVSCGRSTRQCHHRRSVEFDHSCHIEYWISKLFI